MQSKNDKSVSFKKKSNYPILFDKIMETHKCGNLSSTILESITLWDNDRFDNQFKKVQSFECIVCSFNTKKFHVWKHHVMSVSHVSKCQCFEDLYSHPCPNSKCRKLIYGEMSIIKEHILETHNNNTNVSNVTMLMSNNIKSIFPMDYEPLFYCSHCKKSDYDPIHLPDKLPSSIKNVVEHYCYYCNIEFICCPEALDIHSLSVEHLQLKCYYYINLETNSNTESIENNKHLKCNIQNSSCSDLEYNTLFNVLKIPNIVLKRFDFDARSIVYCNLCMQTVTHKTENIISHINLCEYKFDLTGINKTSIKQYFCEICSFNTSNFGIFKGHAVKLQHLTNIYATENLYSFFCFTCNFYIYGNKSHIKLHLQTEHNKNLSRLPELTAFMSKMFKYRNKKDFNNEIMDYFENIHDHDSECDLKYCHACKVDFCSCENVYDLHEITCEHILLKYMTPKNLESKNSIQSIITKNHGLDDINDNLNETIEISTTTDDSLLENQSISSSDFTDNEIKDNINQEKNSPLPYCSLCCTYSENNNENHNNTAEHRLLSQLIESLKPSEDTLIYQIVFSNVFDHKSSTTTTNYKKLVDLQSIKNLLINICTGGKKCIEIIDYMEKLRLKSISEESNNSSNNLINDLASNLRSIELDDNTLMAFQPHKSSNKNYKKPNDFLDASTNTDELIMEYYQDSEHDLNRNVKKRKLHSQILSNDERTETKGESFLQTSHTQSHKNTRESDQDFMYGQYVTERLKFIESMTLKREIKLEIDKVFFSKIKEFI